MLAVSMTPAAAAAQAERETVHDGVYRREVYEYWRAGRPDPFRPLLGTRDAGSPPGELILRGVIHHPDPRYSVAILIEAGTGRRIRARTGEHIGELRIVGIHPRRVDLLIPESGGLRRLSLHLKSEAEAGS